MAVLTAASTAWFSSTTQQLVQLNNVDGAILTRNFKANFPQKRAITMSTGLTVKASFTKGGPGVLERPTFDQSQFDPSSQALEGGDIGRLRDKRGVGSGDSYRVLLIDDSRHSESLEGEQGNPNQRLGSTLLNELNYLPWSRAVTIALGGRSKLGFINGHIKAPEPSSKDYEAWQCKDQLVMSWLLNSMENNIAEIFSYSESSKELWESVKEMYGNQNNAARVFQIKRDLSNLQQNGKTYVQLLGTLKGMWSELALYRPHTTDSVVLKKRDEEDKIFQLLSSLGPEYEDLRSRVLMNSELPSLASVCATIQREEARRKVMNPESRAVLPESHAYVARNMKSKPYKGKRPDLKCTHCHNLGHTIGRCWALHPELKPDFDKEKGPQRGYDKRAHAHAHAAACTTGKLCQNDATNFSTNPAALLSDFATYLKEKGDTSSGDSSTSDSTALLGKFAGFLANSTQLSQENIEVAKVLPRAVPSVTPDDARKLFHESRENGVAVVIVTVKEHAEFYSQMMIRGGLRSVIEPDSSN